MTPEGKTKEAIKKILKGYEPNLYYHMPVQNGMGSPTLDFICCLRGLYIAIEAKALGEVPTKRQALTMQEIEDAGGGTIVVDGSPESLRELRRLLDAPEG